MPPLSQELRRPRARALATALLALLLPVAAFAQANGKLQIHHIDVGQGDGALLISPNGQTALFDDGVYTDCSEIKSYLQALGITTVDYHFASHYHADHIGCIDDLAAIGITIGIAGYDRAYSYSSATYDNYVATLGTKRVTITKGQVITLDAGSANPVYLTCIDLNGAGVYPVNGSDENSKSVVMKVSYGAFDEVLGGDLTGDTSNDVETTVGPEVGDVEVYKVHHHGSRYSSNNNFLDAVSAEVAVISCGDGNTYGHPTQDALDRMHAHNIHTYWTETGAGATPDPAWDKVAHGNIVIQADPGENDSYTVSGPGFFDTYQNGGGGTPPPPPAHATEYASALTLLSGSVASGSLADLQASDDSRLVVNAGGSGRQVLTDWYGSAFLSHPPLSLTVTCETSFSVNRTQTLYAWNWSTSAWDDVDISTVGTSDVTNTWTPSSVADYVGPSNEVRFRVAANSRHNGYQSRGDYLAFDYDYTSGTAPMMAARRAPDASIASRTPETGAPLAGAPGSPAAVLDRERDAALHPQAALRSLSAEESATGASLRWTVGVKDDVDGFNVYREGADRMLVFAGNEAGFDVQGDQVDFRFADADAGSAATYWLGIRSCSGPEQLIGPIRVEATGAAPAELALRIAPNPAAGAAHFEFALDREADVTLEVFDLQGRRIATPVNGHLPAGTVHASWNLRREDGSAVRPGLYFARLETLGRTLFSRVNVVGR